MRKFYLGAVALALLFVLAACSGDSDTFAPEAELETLGQGCENRTNNTYRKLLECVTVDGVRQHQEAFQAIADANEDVYPGTRTAGTVGYQGSVDYVRRTSRRSWLRSDTRPLRVYLYLPSRS